MAQSIIAPHAIAFKLVTCQLPPASPGLKLLGRNACSTIGVGLPDIAELTRHAFAASVGAMLTAIPTMILFYISQSQLQGDLTSGAVKD